MLTFDKVFALCPRDNPAQSAKATPVLITALPLKQESFGFDDEVEETIEAKPADNMQPIPKTEPDITDDLEEVTEEDGAENTAPIESAEVQEVKGEEDGVTAKAEMDEDIYVYDTAGDEEGTQSGGR